jgi:hypothetical protein
VLFSSGDDGDEFTTVGVVSPDYPASSPWVTSVGGTSLAVGGNGRQTGQWGWSTARSFLCNQTLVDEQGCDASQLSGNSSIQDVLPAGKLDQSRADFANSIDPSDGFLYTTRIIDYEGPEQACDTTGDCTTRNVALNARRGYDNMTGLGAPTAGFVPALARR